jgi:hypothetical protein
MYCYDKSIVCRLGISQRLIIVLAGIENSLFGIRNRKTNFEI